MLNGYKGFNQDLTCRGFQYEVGKVYECSGKIGLCINGFHFCKKLQDVHNFYDLTKSRICEIEAFGEIIDDNKKSVCSRIRIIRELSRKEIYSLTNSGDDNMGLFNTGDRNSGSGNTGCRNSGSGNSGNHNSGDYNSGCRNSGNHNSGDYNSGYRNSGNHNSGNWNSGDYNSGYRNSGVFCSCDCSSGIFMSKRITYEAFNKQLTESEYEDLLNSYGFSILELFKLHSYKTSLEKNGQKQRKYSSYKASWRMFWQALTPKQKLAIKRMPHFDSDVFYEITGIRVR